MSQNFLAVRPRPRDAVAGRPARVAGGRSPRLVGLRRRLDEIDLAPLPGRYRDDGWGRAAHDPRDDGRAVALRLRGRRALLAAASKRCSRGRRLPGDRCQPGARSRDARALSGRATRRRLPSSSARSSRLCARAGAGLGWRRSPSTAPGCRPTPRTRQIRTYEQLAREILEEAAAVDAAEDEQFGDKRGDELPPSSPTATHARQRAARRQAATRRRARRQAGRRWPPGRWRWPSTPRDRLRQARATRRSPARSPAPKKARRVNVTDPDSRPVKTATGFIQGYTAQAVATEGQVIVAAELIRAPTSATRLEPMAKGRRGRARRGGINDQPEDPRRRRLLQPRPDRAPRRARGSASSARPTPTAKAPTKIAIRASLRGDATTSQRARRRGGLPAKTADRSNPSSPRSSSRQRAAGPLAPRLIRLPSRMAPDGRDPQPAEALFGRFEASGGLIGSSRSRSSTTHPLLRRLTPAPRFRDSSMQSAIFRSPQMHCFS